MYNNWQWIVIVIIIIKIYKVIARILYPSHAHILAHCFHGCFYDCIISIGIIRYHWFANRWQTLWWTWMLGSIGCVCDIQSGLVAPQALQSRPYLMGFLIKIIDTKGICMCNIIIIISKITCTEQQQTDSESI